MLNVLIWNKYSRVVMLLSKQLGIPTEEALSLFYNSPVFPFLTDKEMPLITMSDQWICDEVGRGFKQRGKQEEHEIATVCSSI